MAAGYLPKSCCIGESVQYTHCIQQVHPSCSIKFKMLLNTDKAEHPGNPPGLGALQGTLHDTEVSASFPPGGTHTHSAHSEPAGARPLRAAHVPRSTLSRVAFLPASHFLALLPADLAVNPGPNPLAVVYLVFCPGGEVSTETEVQ